MRSQSIFYQSWLRLKKNKASLVSAVFIIFICSLALFAKWIAPYNFATQNVDHLLQFPNTQYWFGTDSLGRDLLSRIIYGARMSMAVGIVTAMISLCLGTLYGAVAGWFGGTVDSIMMRAIDVIYSIPQLVLLVMVKVIFDSMNIIEDPELKALFGVLMALSAVGWISLARVVRGQVLQVKEMLYVEAARALGAKSLWIILRHVLPNILGPIIVMLTFQIPANILFESFLSFIGLGLQPPFSSWGVLASEGWRSLRSYPYLMIFPGLFLFLTMMAFQFLGDGLRDAADPHR